MNILFEAGSLYTTPAVKEKLEVLQVFNLFNRHRTGDFGILSEEDKAENLEALTTGGRIFSSYLVGKQKYWVITEADRSTTTVLLPNEY